MVKDSKLDHPRRLEFFFFYLNPTHCPILANVLIISIINTSAMWGLKFFFDINISVDDKRIRILSLKFRKRIGSEKCDLKRKIIRQFGQYSLLKNV